MESLFHLALRAVDQNGIDPDNIDVNTTDPLKVSMSRQYCKVGKCPQSWQTIEYRPSIPGNSVYIACFLVLFGGQMWLGIRYKTWTYMGTILAGILGEIVGYIGRILLNLNPFLMDNFLINLVPLTLAPALLTAGIYLCLGRVIVAKGSENSRLKPKMYTYVFVGCDLLALVLQAIGGGMAATANDSVGSRRGVDIMIAGLISQVVTMVLFLAIWLDFVLRTRRAKRTGTLSHTQPVLYSRLRSTKRFQYFQWSLLVATIFIFIRCVYRVVELWEGFNGHVANHEPTFMVFEGPAIILAVTAMTIFHPGRVFGDLWVSAGKGVVTVSKSNSESSVQLTETERNNTMFQPVARSDSMA